ncbi:hypothetical protein RDWZM_005022 [Blomia tropicalis]|uniref:Uncharacterized protein n=1 Tax=Blomia tropicalis TaxID=40697 RepID=A0A9Q0M4Z0_BLOTA|nr:hypothetical protein BLOT_005413 [Blomia tropicalis]KAJ6219210.1 hypothetical protein RDWZM_005022 [Blomia tropicalis]
MNRCEKDAQSYWEVGDIDENTQTRKFCCSKWDTLKCMVNIAKRCDTNYSEKLTVLYDSAYSDFCSEYGRRSATCALRWWSITLIVIGSILVIGVIFACVLNRLRRRRKQQIGNYHT